MEVKIEKTGLNNSELIIYIDNNPWKRVKTLYYERKIKKILNDPNFKEKFIKLEVKKCLDISLWLLSKRSYLKKEWEQKMRDKLFPKKVAEEVFQKSLHPYFNEEEEIIRRITSYLNRGKGKTWIRQKLTPLTYLCQSHFQELLNDLCNEEEELLQVQKLLHSRNLLEKKGRDKSIQFLLRRGFSYSLISKALQVAPPAES